MIFNKQDIPVYFKPTIAPLYEGRSLSNPRDKTPRNKQSNMVFIVHCSEEYSYLYVGESKQPLHLHIAQHRGATSSGQDSAVHLYLKDKVHLFEGNIIQILDREDRRGVKDAIYIQLEQPSLNRGGGLRHNLSPVYKVVLGSLPR